MKELQLYASESIEQDYRGLVDEVHIGLAGHRLHVQQHCTWKYFKIIISCNLSGENMLFFFFF